MCSRDVQARGSALGLLVALLGGCDPSFSPDWQVPADPGPLDANGAGPGEAGTGDDGGMDAGFEPDAAPMEDGNGIQVGTFKCLFAACGDAGEPDACVPGCIVACADLLCEPDKPCTAAGFCPVDCTLCATPPIK